MPSQHIIDIRWRIAAEEKAAKMPPLAMPSQSSWFACLRNGQWGVMARISARGNWPGYYSAPQQGCVCPVGAEKTCQGLACPRRGVGAIKVT